MYQVKQNNALATSFSVLHSRENQNYQGRSTTQNLLHLPLTVINKYGEESVKYQCLRDWNNFKKKFLQIPEKELSNMKIKRILKQLFLINTERFIHHHQLPYVHPVLFLFSIIKDCANDTIVHDFISVDIHCDIHLFIYIYIYALIYNIYIYIYLYIYILLCYYCSCCYYPLIIIIIIYYYYLFIHLFTYLFICLCLLCHLFIYFAVLTCKRYNLLSLLPT